MFRHHLEKRIIEAPDISVMVYSKARRRKFGPSDHVVTRVASAYYTTHPPFSEFNHIAVAAVGPTALAIQYASVSSEQALILITTHTILIDLIRGLLYHYSLGDTLITSKQSCGSG